MTLQEEIKKKLEQCENDIKSTTSAMRKRDLFKYRTRLLRELKKARMLGK
mgnify:FL=1